MQTDLLLIKLLA